MNMILVWVFIISAGIAYGKFRSDAKTTAGEALFGAVAAGGGMVVVAALVLQLVGLGDLGSPT